MSDDDATMLIPRLTRSERQRAARRRHVPWAWLAYSVMVAAVIVGAAFLAVKG